MGDSRHSVAEAAEIVEVTFKGRRREYYSNPRELPVHVGDYVVVQAERGEDLGRVHHTSEWVKPGHLRGGLRQLLRIARAEDLEALDRNRAREERAFQTCKERIVQRDIEMKLVDAEYQLDGNRLTFFFTAERRVDFRDLVKDLASAFRTRIELRQIGVRDESGRIGGVGTCGRELCPSPSKISGACGRLKCCLRYELDFYKESAREFPKIGSKLTLPDGEWEVARVDIFQRTLYLSDEGGRESMRRLSELPPGTKIVGPSRDRRKGCDKTRCAARGERPGDGESVKRRPLPSERGGGRGQERRKGGRPRAQDRQGRGQGSDGNRGSGNGSEPDKGRDR
jgi:cell fate regulator YaaT (PSP1 superfamily)